MSAELRDEMAKAADLGEVILKLLEDKDENDFVENTALILALAANLASICGMSGRDPSKAIDYACKCLKEAVEKMIRDGKREQN